MNDNHTLDGYGNTGGGWQPMEKRLWISEQPFGAVMSTGSLELEAGAPYWVNFDPAAAQPREETDWRNLPRCDFCRQLAVRYLADQYVLVCDDKGGCLACGAPLEFEHLADHEHVKAVGVPFTMHDSFGNDSSRLEVKLQLMAVDDASAAFERIAQDASELKLAIGEQLLPAFKAAAEGMSKIGEAINNGRR